MVESTKEFDYIKIKLAFRFEYYNGQTVNYRMDNLSVKYKSPKQ
jgi:hypothetical protein